MNRFLLLVVLFLIPSVASADVPDTIEELTAELNVVRAQHGLPPLTTDRSLCTTCQTWSLHLASSGRFYHGGGEQVIAKGQSSAREVIRDWLNSPGHRAWLLSANASVGWGVAVGRDGRYVWAGAFGGSSTATATATTTCGPTGCTTSTATATTRSSYRERVTIRQRLFSRCR